MSNSVAVFSATDGSFIRRFSVGQSPTGLLVANGSLVVLNHKSDAVSFYRLDDLGPNTTVALGKNPVGGAVSADGKLLAIAVSGDDQVAIVDLETFEVTNTLAVGDGPRGIAWIEE
jgi:DNA-binding beta-propeller fold protein YncE